MIFGYKAFVINGPVENWKHFIYDPIFRLNFNISPHFIGVTIEGFNFYFFSIQDFI